jgi:hypothetical protein
MAKQLVVKLCEAIVRGTDEDAKSAKHVGKRFYLGRCGTSYSMHLTNIHDEFEMIATSKVEDISVSSTSLIVYTMNTIYYFEFEEMAK